MRTRFKAGICGLVFLFAFGLFLALPVVPVHAEGNGGMPPVDNNITPGNACDQVFLVLPNNGTTLVNDNQGGYGFRLYNYSLTTAFDFWFSTSQWHPTPPLPVRSDNTYGYSDTTLLLVSGNVEQLNASNDQLSLPSGSFLLAVNGSRDSQFTVTDARAVLGQHNATSVAIDLTASSFAATVGSYMANTYNLPQVSLTLSNFDLTYFLNCSTGQSSYSFSGSMTGAGALGALFQLGGKLP